MAVKPLEPDGATI